MWEDVLIPSIAIFVPAAFAAWQLYENVRLRRRKQRADAMVALSEMLIRAATMTDDTIRSSLGETGVPATTVARAQNNEPMVRAMALLSKRDQVVATWCARRRDDIYEQTQRWTQIGTMLDGTVGPELERIYATATDAMGALTDWLHGQRPTSHFRIELTR